MCFTIYKEKELLHFRSIKTWNMYNARSIYRKLFPTNAEGVQIDLLLMNKLFIYNNVFFLSILPISANHKVVLWDRTFESPCIFYNTSLCKHFI